MSQSPLTRELSEVTPITAGDRCRLQELLHPDRDDVTLRYSLAYATVEPGGRTLPHALDQSEVYYCLAGRAVLYIDSSPYPMQAGTTVYIPPRSTQFVRNESDTLFEFLCIVDPAWTAEEEHVED